MGHQSDCLDLIKVECLLNNISILSNRIGFQTKCAGRKFLICVIHVIVTVVLICFQSVTQDVFAIIFKKPIETPAKLASQGCTTTDNLYGSCLEALIHSLCA